MRGRLKLFTAILTGILVAIIPATIVLAACGGTVRESYTTGDDSDAGVYGVYWEAQTFTPAVDHTVGCVEVKFRKSAGTPGTYTVQIRTTLADKPTATVLCSGTFDGDDVTTDAAGEWVTVDMGAGTALTNGTKYAIVISSPLSDGGNQCRWRWDSGSATYAGGDRCESTDSGTSWTVRAGQDFMFKEADLVGVPTVISDAADNITEDGADLHGEVTADGGDAVTTVGFEWDTDSGAPYANDWNTPYVADIFDHTFATMPTDTTIYWRAYATNGIGTGYSAERNFDTLPPYPSAPTDFTATQTGVNSLRLDWTADAYADNTIIRCKEDGYPADITDGYEVYDGALETLDINGLNLGASAYYYRAWSENVRGYSTDTAETNLGGTTMLLIAFIGLAGFMTWFTSRRRNILLSIISGLMWFSMGMWLFFSATPPFDLSTNYAKMLAWVFVLLTFVPLILFLNVPITKTRKGVSWTEYGEPPDEHKSEYQKYAEDLHARMYRHKKKKKLW